ncbi:hypothetical protein NEF87_002943 [Candidatus Lokiarchaeum ossiferum]|uniref:YcxB-like protein domain-containing protein n=1 Tax=Candidatus Lokiarchaeum ossiferum TaxID=2951803 RepID=A0ABY6HT24_9ARCH|nr:hypothetical protein NEF87_002943 [Candidatus Lokiarchaeum sp. B-35]
MTNNNEIPELKLPIPETLTFFKQDEKYSAGNYIRIVLKVIFAIIILIFGIIRKQLLISMIEDQSLSPQYHVLFLVIIYALLGLFLFEIGRDIYISLLPKYAKWRTIKFFQNRILLDSVELDLNEISKIHILAKLNWIALELDEINRNMHIILFFKTKRPVVLYNVYQSEGFLIPKDKIHEISKFCKHTYSIQPKTKFQREYGMIILIFGIILALIFLI